jgi:hypothetical protein
MADLVELVELAVKAEMAAKQTTTATGILTTKTEKETEETYTIIRTKKLTAEKPMVVMAVMPTAATRAYLSATQASSKK